ncbi:MAG TPA: transcriptional repressor [Candidatus Saccharimonadales bacterium]|jgi:Fe2+ or Zn2+ uptake regulation protein|nr:transcriptional repressor [Candidatus Saccharimonadales bacterium]
MKSEILIQGLKDKKKRLTPARTKIIQILCTTPSPITAEILVKKVNINKTTAYRELEFLLKNELIQEVDFGDGTKRYELKELKHHHHLVCLRCKSVQDISFDENLEWEESRIKKNQRFEVLRHDLEFFGYCNNCTPK